MLYNNVYAKNTHYAVCIQCTYPNTYTNTLIFTKNDTFKWYYFHVLVYITVFSYTQIKSKLKRLTGWANNNSTGNEIHVYLA